MLLEALRVLKIGHRDLKNDQFLLKVPKMPFREYEMDFGMKYKESIKSFGDLYTQLTSGGALRFLAQGYFVANDTLPFKTLRHKNINFGSRMYDFAVYTAKNEVDAANKTKWVKKTFDPVTLRDHPDRKLGGVVMSVTFVQASTEILCDFGKSKMLTSSVTLSIIWVHILSRTDSVS